MNRRHHPVWNDVLGPAVEGVGASSLTNVAYRGTAWRLLAMSSTGTDRLSFAVQMPHSWDGKSKVHPHIHWVPLVAPAADRVVLFEGVYCWSLIGEVIPDLGSWTAFSVQAAVPVGGEFVHRITEMAEIEPPAGAGPSTFLLVDFTRNGASATDTYTDGGPSNVGILNVDTHYLYTRQGSLDEFGLQQA